ncbi:MAG: aldehyde ferredoxin oxidoreductase family protein [Thermoleophilia bacterium]
MISRILYADLTTGTVAAREEKLERPLGLGGKALALALLESRLDPRAEASSPDNPVILTSSPMAEYAFPGSSRGGAFTRSPLTNRFLESYSGGAIGRSLKEAGWDAVVIEGRAKEPVRLHVDSEGGSLESASDLWGKDVFESDDALLCFGDRRMTRLVIGPGGENGAAFASVHNDKFHAFGRGGLGTVFGSKRLKAVTVQSPGPSRREGGTAFEAARSKVAAEAKDSPSANAYRRLGTPMMVALLNEAGGFPSRYWSKGVAPHRERLEAESYRDWAEVKTESCAPCPMRCRKRLQIKEGKFAGRAIHGPEYESIYAFGGLCMIEDPQEVAFLHEECNRLGVDTITAGNVIGLAMAARDEGLRDDAPEFGDFDATLELLRSMAAGNGGLAGLLAGGVRPAAAELGLEEAAVHVKGMDPAGYDPRALKGMALAYASSPRGACHLRATFYKPILGGLTDDLDEQGLAKLFLDFEDRLFLHDCLVMCRFYRDYLDWETLAAMTGELAGQTITPEDLRQTVRALLTRVRRLNFALGMTADEDRLPSRFFTEELERAQPLEQSEFDRTMAAYYELRGWPGGRPA